MWQPKSKSFNNPLQIEEVAPDHPVRRFYTYWQALCGHQKFARKADFNPAEIPELLANIAITKLDYSGPEFDISLTLVGERIKDILLIKKLGTYRRDFFSGDELRDRLYLYDHMAQEQQVKIFRMKAPFSGRDFIEYIVGLFPFSSDGQRVTHFFLVIESI
ncbi:MAG: PAS domain-containing protein [Alphaproteobacteria bacterium]|nr:PAS domain-containing protein [Alphaproteobacteria bacterium]